MRANRRHPLPEPVGGHGRALCKGAQLGVADGRVDLAEAREGGEAAVGAGEHAIAASMSAKRQIRSATRAGCSTKFETESITPGISTLSSGTPRSAKTVHSWAWRGFAASNEILLIHESPLTDALFLLVSKSDEVTTT